MIAMDRSAVAPLAGAEVQEEIELLSCREAYSDPTDRVECIETHISWVFLTDRRVYKLKKPVRFDFLDYSTVQRRKQACEAEVQLNRRLAPHTYLGVLPVIRNRFGRLQLGGSGATVDWVVAMRRLNADRSLEALICSGRITPSQVAQLADRLADFYRRLPPLTIRAQEYRQRIEAHVRANHAVLCAAVDKLDVAALKRLYSRQLRVLSFRPEWLENRVCDGRVVEGHGDLRPDHIYFQPGPIVIDCIEFNAEFRQLDVLDELSFLAMECDLRQVGWIGRQVLERYRQTNDDRPPDGLLAFYKCYRATVHAKVAALRAAQHPADAQAAWDQARQYVHLADSYAADLGPPLLVVMRGPAGCGKSSVAAGLSERLGLEVLQTDSIRHELFPAAERATQRGDVYGEGNRGRVYHELLRRAEQLMDQQLSLILDGTFGSPRWLTAALAAGTSRHFATLVVDCRCPDEVALKRIADRLQAGGAVSEATPDVYRRQRQAFESLPEGLPVCRLNTAHSLPALLARVHKRLRGILPA